MVKHASVSLPSSRTALRRLPHHSRWIAAASALLLSAFSTGCRTAPIRDIVDVPFPNTSYAATSGDRDEAIWRAGRKAGWEIERIRPGVLRGTWRFKHHFALVSITHDLRRFSIHYEDSRNLLHSGDQIHRNYNDLVRRLADWIQREPARPSAIDPSQ